MASAIRCRNCGELSPQDARFCDHCGAAWETEPDGLGARIAALETENRRLAELMRDEERVNEELQARLSGSQALQGRLLSLEEENERLTAKVDEAARAGDRDVESLRAKVAELEAKNREAQAHVPALTTKQFSPRGRTVVRLSRRQLYLGISLVAFGVLTMVTGALTGTTNLAGLGLASFLIGLLVVYLPSQATLPPELVEASLLSPLAGLERVLRELSPNTKAVYLKTEDRLQMPLVFLPLDGKHGGKSSVASSAYDRFMVMDAKDPSRNGLLLEAPGGSLLSYMEREAGVDFFDLTGQDLIGTLRSCMVESLEVAAEVKGEVAPNGVRFRIRDGVLGHLSETVVKSAGNVSSRLGCPICSAGICAAVKVLKREVEVDKATHAAGYHSVNLTYNGGLPSEAD